MASQSMVLLCRISLQGSISTTNYGYSKLMMFYNECSTFNGGAIEICLKYLEWIDANMSAVLQGIIHKLTIENNLRFHANLDEAKIDLNVLVCNGLIHSDKFIVKDRGTTVNLRGFSIGDDDAFVNYVENDLLDHPGLVLDYNSKEDIIDAFIEIFANYGMHSKTSYPCYVCGQYYPRIRTLKFTFFDLGIGFLKPINDEYPNIKTNDEAITWALEDGNSSKTDTPGGTGLSKLKNCLTQKNGGFEIVSGDAYKKFHDKNDYEIGKTDTLKCRNIGTAINLFFKDI